MGLASWLCSFVIGMSSHASHGGLTSAGTAKQGQPPWIFYLLCAICQVAACLVGGLTGQRIEKLIGSGTAALLGSSILVSIGLWMMLQRGFAWRSSDLESSDTAFGFSEMMFVVLAQILADLSLGFGVAFVRLHVVVAAFSSASFSVAFLLMSRFGGNWLRRLGRSEATVYTAAAIFVLVGIMH